MNRPQDPSLTPTSITSAGSGGSRYSRHDKTHAAAAAAAAVIAFTGTKNIRPSEWSVRQTIFIST